VEIPRRNPFSMIHHARFEQWIPAPIERVFMFFANPENLPRIRPPEIGTVLVRMKLVPPPGRAGTESTRLAGTGSEIVASFRPVPFLPFLSQWMAEITDFEWNHHFADVQRKGPFKSFHHRHELIAENQRGVTGTVILDVIDYDVGFGWLGQLAERVFIGPQLRRTFAYRQKALADVLK
jgi:ligand-binding SRPBCC domain-containing protein